MALSVQQNLDQDRVSAYLDDKLQNSSDLDSLGNLLGDIEARYALLKKQLDDATQRLDHAKTSAREHTVSLQRQNDGFHRQQADIAKRLSVLGLSDTSDEAVVKFEGSEKKKERLDVAFAYFDLLQNLGKLSSECQQLLASPRGDALEPYRRLQSLVTQLTVLHESAEMAGDNLLEEVNKTAQNVYRRIKDTYSANLDKILTEVSWPDSDSIVPQSLQQQWHAAVGRLIDLQMPDLLAQEMARTQRGSNHPPLVLLPLEVLAAPLEMRFRYHFDGDRATNRLEHPEFFLSHVLSLLDEHVDFVAENIQPVLRERFKGTDLALNAGYIDATSAFITSLLPMLRTKIFSTITKVIDQPELLSHLIHEIKSFDTRIREDWRYDGGYGLDGWKGLTWEVLSTGGWFARWLQVEKDFAYARYDVIVGSSENNEIDFESVDASITKPTKAALQINDLLETITDRYKDLSSFSQKLRFLIDIQITILDREHTRLNRGLDAYNAFVSTSSGNLSIQNRLDRLCRIYGSLDYLERAMRDWSDDVFFLELWQELQDRASRNARHESVFSSTHPTQTVSDVAARTSTGLGDSSISGALFDETAASYDRLRTRTEIRIIDTLRSAAREALLPFGEVTSWSGIQPAGGSEAHSSQLSPSAELDGLLRLLRESVGYLKKALSSVALHRVARAVLSSAQDFLWSRVLCSHIFSAAGAAQLQADVAAICIAVDQIVGTSLAQSTLRKVTEGVRLLNLPVHKAEKGLDLRTVDRMLSSRDGSGAEVLETLGLDALNITDAQTVVKGRVELKSK